MVRGAVANLRDKGVDGLSAWFFRWPFGDPERAMLCEIGDSELSRENTRHYFIPWRNSLEVALHSRPEDLHGEIAVVDLEVVVEFADFPSVNALTEREPGRCE